MRPAPAAGPEMAHMNPGDFILGCVIFLTLILVGLLALIRPGRVNAVHLAMIRLTRSPPARLPGLVATRVVGTLFVLVGTFLLGTYIFDYYFR